MLLNIKLTDFKINSMGIQMSCNTTLSNNLDLISRFNELQTTPFFKAYLKVTLPDGLEISYSKTQASPLDETINFIEKLSIEVLSFSDKHNLSLKPIDLFLKRRIAVLNTKSTLNKEVLSIKTRLVDLHSLILKSSKSEVEKQVFSVSDDLLSFIISFIPLRQRNKLRLVSKQFLHLIDTQRTCLKINKVPDLSEFSILRRWPKIKKIDFATTDVTNLHLSFLSQFSHIQDLNLEDCSKITDLSLFEDPSFTHLTKLNLSSSQNISSNNYIFLKNCLVLNELSLSRVLAISDNELELIGSITSLKKLDLSVCQLITNNGLTHLSKLSQLSYLKLANCPLITDEGLASLSLLPELTSLNLSLLPRISDLGLTVLQKLEKLTFLDLVESQNIRIETPNTIASFSCLKELDLSCCTFVNDIALLHISNNLDLHVLRLFGCKLVTDNGVLTLSKMRQLRLLDVIECPKVSKVGIKTLKIILKNLKILF